MSREHIVRIEKLAKYHEEYPEKVKCSASYEERCESIEEFRDAFFESVPEVFTSPVRTGIIFFLMTLGEACVCEVQLALNEPSQPLVSHHLREMKKAGWLTSERRGRWTYYSMKSDKKAAITRLLSLMKEE